MCSTAWTYGYNSIYSNKVHLQKRTYLQKRQVLKKQIKQTCLYLQIQYDKQCGKDNFCDTDLELRVIPLTDSGHLVYGKDRNLDVQVTLYNAKENAYNIIIDVDVEGNISSALRTILMQGW